MDKGVLTKIDSMVRALGALSYISAGDQDEEYNRVIASINDYIMKHCIHDKVYDSIDTGPESSKTICFCLHCYTTFS